jgi:hypothetical protein
MSTTQWHPEHITVHIQSHVHITRIVARISDTYPWAPGLHLLLRSILCPLHCCIAIGLSTLSCLTTPSGLHSVTSLAHCRRLGGRSSEFAGEEVLTDRLQQQTGKQSSVGKATGKGENRVVIPAAIT